MQAAVTLGSVSNYFVRCVVVKIVNDKALAAAHIENMSEASNAGSGDFDHNPQGRDDLAPVRCRAFACLPTGKPRSTLLALRPNRRRRTHEMIVNRPCAESGAKCSTAPRANLDA